MEVLTVSYKSGLALDKVLERFRARGPRYREVPGLQKLYVHAEGTGEVGGIYVSDSKANLDRFLQSDLAGSLGTAYEVAEPPTRRVHHVVMLLHPDQPKVV